MVDKEEWKPDAAVFSVVEFDGTTLGAITKGDLSLSFEIFDSMFTIVCFARAKDVKSSLPGMPA